MGNQGKCKLGFLGIWGGGGRVYGVIKGGGLIFLLLFNFCG